MSKTKEIVPAETTMLVSQNEIPDWLKGQVGHQEGMENVEQGDLLIPRLSVCQALSPQRKKSDPAFIPGLEEGQLFNTVTGEIYGEKITLIALFFFKNRIKFFDIDSGGGIDCQSQNGVDGGRISPDGCSACDHARWGNGATDQEHANDAPDCTLYHNFMAFNPTELAPIAVSYKSTGLKVSKQFLSTVRMTRLPMYAKYIEVSVKELTSGKNSWFEKKITPKGFVEKDVFVQMENQFKALKEANIRVDTTGEEGDTSFDPDGSEASAF